MQSYLKTNMQYVQTEETPRLLSVNPRHSCCVWRGRVGIIP